MFDYFDAHGVEDVGAMQQWMRKVEEAVREAMLTPAQLDAMLKKDFMGRLNSVVGKIALTNHKGVSRFTVQNIHPRLRAMVDQRILMSANLIKLNRDEMIGKTLHRMMGWLSSIPAAERGRIQRAKLKENFNKPLASLPFLERRVMIDQGYKLTSAINAAVAEEGGAIAAQWYSHYRQEGYDYREEHKLRDELTHKGGKVYMIRDSWAIKQGLAKKGPLPWLDEIDQAGELPYCRCHLSYLYHLRQLPIENLTQKGLDALKAVRGAA
jgi:hypothetical protein